MSLHRENIIWQSKDKTWNIGFWEFFNTGAEMDDPWDHEWDVEYTRDAFWFASTGHATPDAAARAFRGPNPGGHSELPYSRGNAKEAAELDELAWAFKNPEAAAKKKAAAWKRELTRLQKPILETIGNIQPDAFYGTWQIMVKTGPGYGHMTTEGIPTMKNGWLHIGQYKAFNPTTKKFGPNIADFKQVPARRTYGSYRGW